jgi:hypothetical protein
MPKIVGGRKNNKNLNNLLCFENTRRGQITTENNDIIAEYNRTSFFATIREYHIVLDPDFER